MDAKSYALFGSVFASVFAFGALCVAITHTHATAAIPPSPIDVAFATGTEKDVTTAITESDVFKRAVHEAVAARDKRKGEIGSGKKVIGITPEQAARQRFIEVLQGK